MRPTMPILGLVLALAATVSAAPAAIQVDSTVREFGAVRQGTILDLEFEVRNTGGEPLTLEVKPTCGCTVVDFDQSIDPGGQGVIRAKVDTTEFTGAITKSVLVVSNDPERPTLRLLARAEVQPVLAVLPRPIVRLGAVEGTAASDRVILAPTEAGLDYRVLQVASSLPFLKAQVRPLAADEQVEGYAVPQYALELTLSGDAPLGIVNGEVKVTTDLDGARLLTVKVVGRVVSG